MILWELISVNTGIYLYNFSKTLSNNIVTIFQSFNVVVGEHDINDSNDGTVHSVSRILEHPSYSSSSSRLNYDFAIITLSSPVTSSSRVNAACLPPSSWGGNYLDGKSLKVSGWGTTSQGGSTPAVLHSVNVNGISNSQCNSLYGSTQITGAMLCAGNVANGGVDSCQGDSGGTYITKIV